MSFFSRRNEVSLVREGGRHVVKKMFVAGNARHEWDILSRCHTSGLAVPEPLSISLDTITMEYIPGQTYADRPLLTHHQCKMLAGWLFSFHMAFTGTRKGDAMLRNFIENGTVTYGIDFEEAGPGDGLEDVALLCASILTENPIFTQTKINEARWVAACYLDLARSRSHEELSAMLETELEKIAARRKDGSDILSRMPVGKTVIL